MIGLGTDYTAEYTLGSACVNTGSKSTRDMSQFCRHKSGTKKQQHPACQRRSRDARRGAKLSHRKRKSLRDKRSCCAVRLGREERQHHPSCWDRAPVDAARIHSAPAAPALYRAIHATSRMNRILNEGSPENRRGTRSSGRRRFNRDHGIAGMHLKSHLNCCPPL